MGPRGPLPGLGSQVDGHLRELSASSTALPTAVTYGRTLATRASLAPRGTRATASVRAVMAVVMSSYASGAVSCSALETEMYWSFKVATAPDTCWESPPFTASTVAWKDTENRPRAAQASDEPEVGFAEAPPASSVPPQPATARHTSTVTTPARCLALILRFMSRSLQPKDDPPSGGRRPPEAGDPPGSRRVIREISGPFRLLATDSLAHR